MKLSLIIKIINVSVSSLPKFLCPFVVIMPLWLSPPFHPVPVLR